MNELGSLIYLVRVLAWLAHRFVARLTPEQQVLVGRVLGFAVGAGVGLALLAGWRS